MASKSQASKSAPATQSERRPPDSSVPKSYWCRTQAELTDEVDYEWTIERFAFLDDGKKWEPMTSPEFSDSKFRLRLNVDNCRSQFYIMLFSSVTFEYSILVDIVISDEKQKKKVFKVKTSIFANTQYPVRVFEIFKEELLKSGNFVSGDITISCKIRSLKRKQQTGKAAATNRYLDETVISDNNQDLILQQLQELFDKMPLKDVTFNIRGRKFAAHKTILAMRSPMFAAMFHHPTKEVLSSQVEVEDIDPDVFQEVLRFIYTGKTQSTAMNKMAPGLLAAADKYLLADLKTRCETHLIRQMSAENCLELLSLTTHHPAEHLKKYAIDYFRRYPVDVMKTDTWKKMKEDNPAALCDLQQMVLTAPTV